MMNARSLPVLALVMLVVAGTSSPATGATGATISARMTKTSFSAAKAGTVKVTYRFSRTSKRYAYLLTVQKGSMWRTVKSVKRTGTFKGSHTVTVKSLFAGNKVNVGRYRLKLSADGGSKRLTFNVLALPKALPKAGTWVTTSLSGPVSDGRLTVTGMSFAVRPDQARVAAFGFEFDYSGTPAPPSYNCSGSGSSRMTSDNSSPIAGGRFSSPSPTGAWSSFVSGSADGTFDSATSAHGTAKATGIIMGPGCFGSTSASTGTFSWTATWSSGG